MVTALVTWLVAMNPVVRFTGDDVGCPTAAEVDARLRTLLPTASPSGERDVAVLGETGSRLRVTVRRPDGTTLGERELDRAHSCADLAAAVALVIATWESDVHPEFALALPGMAEPARPSPIAPGGRAADSPDLERAPPRAELTSERSDAPAAVPPRTARSAFDLGAALVASAAPHTLDGSFQSDLVAAGAVVAGWVHEGRGPGLRLALGIAADRVVPLGSGEAHWRRATAAFGPQLRLSSLAATVLDLHGELTAAGLNVRGQRFATNDDGWSFDLGAGAGARLWMGTGTWRPWVDLSAVVWPIEHVVYAAPSREGVSLPGIEMSLALGIAFFRS